MKVSEILQSDMCNDNTEIYIDKPAGPANVASRFHGNWYQDRCLDYADDVVVRLIYDRDINKISMEVCND